MLYIFKYQKESMTIMRNKVDVIRNSQIETQDIKYTVFYMKLLIQNWSVESPCGHININQRMCETFLLHEW